MKNKIVVVTGAANGIGKSITKEYANKGATVILADKDHLQGKLACEEIVKNGGQADFLTTDVSSPSAIEELFKRVVQKYAKIDVLINNAGISRWKSPYELSVEEWDQILNTNLRSVFLCSREAAKTMRENGGGHIVNIASTRALMSEQHSEAYAASKGGIIALTHALAASFAPDHIQVNSISPGWIETGDYNALRQEDHAQHFSARVGKPDDIARACLFLTDERNNFINAENIVIDGGMTRKMIYEE
ncbi:MAG: 3-oxoacyl-(acyl-carrier-protein) reductase [Bacteroidetes bacterium]|nr:3-oxoacyl-(acyl-carrier-protein) reductase [Bacteroidota bacterium]